MPLVRQKPSQKQTVDFSSQFFVNAMFRVFLTMQSWISWETRVQGQTRSQLVHLYGVFQETLTRTQDPHSQKTPFGSRSPIPREVPSIPTLTCKRQLKPHRSSCQSFIFELDNIHPLKCLQALPPHNASQVSKCHELCPFVPGAAQEKTFFILLYPRSCGSEIFLHSGCVLCFLL